MEPAGQAGTAQHDLISVQGSLKRALLSPSLPVSPRPTHTGIWDAHRSFLKEAKGAQISGPQCQRCCHSPAYCPCVLGLGRYLGYFWDGRFRCHPLGGALLQPAGMKRTFQSQEGV